MATPAQGNSDDFPLLRLTIDLGSDPTLYEIALNHIFLSNLCDRSGQVYQEVSQPLSIVEPPHPSPRRLPSSSRYRRENPSYRVVSSTIASPWVTVLSELASSAPPLAYGLGSLFTLERLLKMVMEWQNHRAALGSSNRDGDDVEEAFLLLAEHDNTGNQTYISRRVVEAVIELGRIESVEIVRRVDE